MPGWSQTKACYRKEGYYSYKCFVILLVQGRPGIPEIWPDQDQSFQDGFLEEKAVNFEVQARCQFWESYSTFKNCCTTNVKCVQERC
eukprot:1159058-Pelagomonas_calceolata.AAC.13